MTVRRLLDEIDSSELTEWIAFSVIEPFGPEADDYRAGVMPALHANSNRRDSGARPFRPRDFFPWSQQDE